MSNLPTLVVNCNPKTGMLCCNQFSDSPKSVVKEKPKEEPSNMIEVTVTLKPFLYAHNPNVQMKMTKDLLKKCFGKYSVSIVAELTNEYNIHYHCMVDMKTHKEPLFYLHNKIRPHKQFGRRTVQRVQYYESYIKYMNKDIKKTNEILSQSAIVKDDLNILGVQHDRVWGEKI